MKKVFSFLMCLAVLLAPMTVSAVDQSGQPTKKEIKAAQKSAKKSAKEFKKDGWKFNSAGDAVSIVKNHLLKMEEYGGGGVELVGNANAMRSINLGKTRAQMAAINEYCRADQMALKIRLDGMDKIIDDAQAESLINAYEGRVAAEIQGEVKHSFTVYKKNSDGTYEVQSFYILDKANAAKARIRAAKADAEFEKVAIQIAGDISKFVNGQE